MDRNLAHLTSPLGSRRAPACAAPWFIVFDLLSSKRALRHPDFSNAMPSVSTVRHHAKPSPGATTRVRAARRLMVARCTRNSRARSAALFRPEPRPSRISAFCSGGSFAGPSARPRLVLEHALTPSALERTDLGGRILAVVRLGNP